MHKHIWEKFQTSIFNVYILRAFLNSLLVVLIEFKSKDLNMTKYLKKLIEQLFRKIDFKGDKYINITTAHSLAKIDLIVEKMILPKKPWF